MYTIPLILFIVVPAFLIHQGTRDKKTALKSFEVIAGAAFLSNSLFKEFQTKKCWFYQWIYNNCFRTVWFTQTGVPPNLCVTGGLINCLAGFHLKKQTTINYEH